MHERIGGRDRSRVARAFSASPTNASHPGGSFASGPFAHERPDAMSAREKLGEQPRADVAGAAGDEDPMRVHAAYTMNREPARSMLARRSIDASSSAGSQSRRDCSSRCAHPVANARQRSIKERARTGQLDPKPYRKGGPNEDPRSHRASFSRPLSLGVRPGARARSDNERNDGRRRRVSRCTRSIRDAKGSQTATMPAPPLGRRRRPPPMRNRPGIFRS